MPNKWPGAKRSGPSSFAELLAAAFLLRRSLCKSGSRCSRSSVSLLIVAGVQSGCSCRNSADEPATCGVATLVPWNMAKPLPGTDDKTFTPGAQTSGLMSSRLAGPRLENSARKFWLFVGHG